ncbi:MAG: hypothetical protein QF785_00535 [Phycisphaeraceae bacterium]|nr:hypothetical protein [Phycisphaeraceae bacterium]
MAKPHSHRLAAVVAWQQGIDGICLLSFHHVVQRNETGDTQVTSELGDADKFSRRDKLYMVAGSMLSDTRSTGRDRTNHDMKPASFRGPRAMRVPDLTALVHAQ